MSSSYPEHPNRLPDEILARLAAAGLRRTLATRAVLGLFVTGPGVALTHTQVAALLRARGLEVNRVTLYRLLDRLVACGALRREADDDSRTWRFQLAVEGDGAATPQFECDSCHQRLRLDAAGEATRTLVDGLLSRLTELGHQGMRVELAIHGTCAGCADGTPPSDPEAPAA